MLTLVLSPVLTGDAVFPVLRRLSLLIRHVNARHMETAFSHEMVILKFQELEKALMSRQRFPLCTLTVNLPDIKLNQKDLYIQTFIKLLPQLHKHNLLKVECFSCTSHTQ